jgi:hypothetical protein
VELTSLSRRTHEPPSPRLGWQQARRLWRLVLAVWIASLLAVAPALVLLGRIVAPALSSLPAGPGEVPDGDVALILLEAVREAQAPLVVAVLSGLAVAWAWAVLWHAGVVRWLLGTGAAPIRLGALLRLGTGVWWRYARLSLTALVALAVVAAAVWLPLGWGVARGFAAMTERRLIAVASAGALASAVVVMVAWLAVLHGAWLLGLPGRRSAVMAWLRGLQATARRPVAGLWTVLVWVVPALLASAVAPLLGAAFAGLRGGLLLIAIGMLASLARAFCWVGLFCSFAPITGVVGIPEDRNADGKKAVQEILYAQEAWQEEDGEGDPPKR